MMISTKCRLSQKDELASVCQFEGGCGAVIKALGYCLNDCAYKSQPHQALSSSKVLTVSPNCSVSDIHFFGYKHQPDG